MGAQGTATIDFGAAPGSHYTTVVVTDALVLSTSAIESWKMASSTASHNIIEHILVPIVLTCEPNAGGGSFIIHAHSELTMTGTFLVNWVWN